MAFFIIETHNGSIHFFYKDFAYIVYSSIINSALCVISLIIWNLYFVI